MLKAFSCIWWRLAKPVITSPVKSPSYIYCGLPCSNAPIQLIDQLEQGCHWAPWQGIKRQLPCSDTPILSTHLIVLYFSSWSCARCAPSVQNISAWRLKAWDKEPTLEQFQPVGILSVKALSCMVSTRLTVDKVTYRLFLIRYCFCVPAHESFISCYINCKMAGQQDNMGLSSDFLIFFFLPKN